MTDIVAAPVKGILNAYQRGATLTQRICKFAHHGSATHSLDTIQPAQSLEKSLRQSEKRIKDAYNDSTKSLGSRFAEEIISDAAITNRLQALTINLQDQVMSLDEYMDDPEAFDLGSFGYIRRESERACSQAIHTLGMLEKALTQAGLHNFSLIGRTDRTLLNSQGSDSQASLTPPATAASERSYMTNGTSLSPKAAIPARSRDRIQPKVARDRNASVFDPVSQYADLPTAGSYGTFKEAGPPPPPKSPKNLGMPLAPRNVWAGRMRNLRDPIELDALPQYSFDDHRVVQAVENRNLSGLTLRNRSNSEGASSIHSPSVLSEMLRDSPTFTDRESATAALVKSANIIRRRKLNDESSEKRRRSQDLNGRSRSPSSTSSHIAPSNSSIIGNIMDILGPSENNGVVVATEHTENSGKREAFSPESHDAQTPRAVPTKHVAHLQMSPTEPTFITAEAVVEDQSDVHPLFRTQRRPTTPVQQPEETASQSPTSVYSCSTNAYGQPFMGARPDSEPMMFGLESPCNSAHIQEHTVALPSYEIEDGIQVVSPGLLSDSGIMLANDSGRADVALPLTISPLISASPSGFPIAQDASFYKYGGFCEGAKMLQRGQKPLKPQKKPGGLGFTAVVSMKCSKCSYEIGFESYDADAALDRAAIYTVKGGGGGLRFRQRFLSKSHMFTKHTLDSAYGCLFCIEESRTVDDHDATVFFTVTALLTHIQKHQRPLPNIPGVKVLYGQHTGALDFDLCFRTMTPIPNPFHFIDQKLQDRPTARALANHRVNHKNFRGRDPDGHTALHFAAGARILGITYPDRHNGQWCCGYHDNVRAFFPSSLVQLDAPADPPRPSPKSTLVATAKWAHKPPSHLSSTWLSFKSGEKISNINFVYQEFWCWSGMNTKGKYGLFHSAFMKDVIDTNFETDGSVRSLNMALESLSQTISRRNSSAITNRDSLQASLARESLLVTGDEIYDGGYSEAPSSPQSDVVAPFGNVSDTLSPASGSFHESCASSIVHPGTRVTESLRPVRRQGSVASTVSAESDVGELPSSNKTDRSGSVFPTRFFMGLGRRNTGMTIKNRKSEDSIASRLRTEGIL